MQLHDTLSKSLKEIPEGELKIYACGVTVYDFCHIGHARSYLSWDILRRWLRHRKRLVNFVQNFTDLDDKIIQRAHAQGLKIQDFTQPFINAYFEDMGWLNVVEDGPYPRVTTYFQAIREGVEDLLRKGFAYEHGGDIKFRGDKYPRYGQLSGAKQCEDFTLWKGPKPDEPEFPRGRPGWHMECSIMVELTLGETIDIHCGGADLVFPHHENEIAQSECLHDGKPLANHWLHNGFVENRGEKMGKSLGNAMNIRDLRQQGIDPNVVRYWVLQANYRHPLGCENLFNGNIEHQWRSLEDKLHSAPDFGISVDFVRAMDADLNTPVALAELHRNPTKEMANLLGFRPVQRSEEKIPNEVLEWASRRAELRSYRNYRDADVLRRKIALAGFSVKDNRDGTFTIYRP